MKRLLFALLYSFIFVVFLAGAIQEQHNPDPCKPGFGLRQETC